MPKRILKGVVVSSKADKTIIVKVETKKTHEKYGKILRFHKKYAAHDPNNKYVNGDQVLIVESRPISKTKTFIVQEIV